MFPCRQACPVSINPHCSVLFGLGVLALITLVGCNRSPEPEQPAPQVSAQTAQADRELAMYRDLLAAQSYELAAPIGQEVVSRFPDSAAAQEIGKTLPDTVSKSDAAKKKRRLTKLWAYQSGSESGGQQVSASIYSEDPVATRIRLVLRRHSEWGQSAYLFGPGFRCGKPCTISMRFDGGASQRFEASIPPTGEPALFIEEDARFIREMQKTESIAMDVTQKDGRKRTVVFAVGGYDPDRFPDKPGG